MLLRNDHPNVTPEDWQAFKETVPPSLIKEVIDRGEIILPDWFVPLARGVAFASDDLLQRAGYKAGSRRPPGWRKTHCDVYLKRTVPGPDARFAALTVRQYEDQDWYTVERYHEDRKKEEITDVLAFEFGSTPIFCRNFEPAMWLAEHCQLNHPPAGLRWVCACPDDKDAAVEFARQRRLQEAAGQGIPNGMP